MRRRVRRWVDVGCAFYLSSTYRLNNTQEKLKPNQFGFKKYLRIAYDFRSCKNMHFIAAVAVLRHWQLKTVRKSLCNKIASHEYQINWKSQLKWNLSWIRHTSLSWSAKAMPTQKTYLKLAIHSCWKIEKILKRQRVSLSSSVFSSAWTIVDNFPYCFHVCIHTAYSMHEIYLLFQASQHQPPMTSIDRASRVDLAFTVLATARAPCK